MRLRHEVPFRHPELAYLEPSKSPWYATAAFAVMLALVVAFVVVFVVRTF